MIDPLIRHLNQCPHGVKLAENWLLPVLIFADDFVLIAGSTSAAQALIDICADFAKRHAFKFGLSTAERRGKTEFMVVAPPPDTAHTPALGTRQSSFNQSWFTAVARGARSSFWTASPSRLACTVISGCASVKY